jgi:nicotinate-nucleotide adenylyltransferase
MAPLDARLAHAREVARHPQIVVTDIERALGTRYTIDTIRALKRRYPRVRFVWIMGGDNFAELRRWKRWQAIMAAVPIAVVARPGYGFAALASLVAQRYAKARHAEHRARALLQCKPPAWLYQHAPLNPLSSTELRAASGWPRPGGEAQTGSSPPHGGDASAARSPPAPEPMGTRRGRSGGKARRGGRGGRGKGT